jgi:biopolymer transport protein ExbD
MASSSDQDDGGLFAAINVTPLVDIMLVLLVAVMVAAPLIVSNPSIKVALPRAATAEETKASPLILSMTRQPGGSYKLFENGKETDEAGIRTRVPRLVKSDPELQAVIAADRGIPYGDVMHIVDLVRALGVTKFALNAESGGGPNAGGLSPGS